MKLGFKINPITPQTVCDFSEKATRPPCFEASGQARISVAPRERKSAATLPILSWCISSL